MHYRKVLGKILFAFPISKIGSGAASVSYFANFYKEELKERKGAYLMHFGKGNLDNFALLSVSISKVGSCLAAVTYIANNLKEKLWERKEGKFGKMGTILLSIFPTVHYFDISSKPYTGKGKGSWKSWCRWEKGLYDILKKKKKKKKKMQVICGVLWLVIPCGLGTLHRARTISSNHWV